MADTSKSASHFFQNKRNPHCNGACIQKHTWDRKKPSIFAIWRQRLFRPSIEGSYMKNLFLTYDISGLDIVLARRAAIGFQPPSTIAALIGHAADALAAYADTARWHHSRAISRGLEGMRGTRALDGAAERADALAGELKCLIVARYIFTDADWPWLEADFAKINSSRRTAIKATEKDFWAQGRNDMEGPELMQLREIEHVEAMYAALSAVATVAEAIRHTLAGDWLPERARTVAAEAMAALYNQIGYLMV